MEKPFDFSQVPPEKVRLWQAAAVATIDSPPTSQLCDFVRTRRQAKTHGPGVYWVAYSYDGSMIATCGHDKRVSIRNGEDGSVIR